MIAWFFARKPSRILEYIGKFLNPVFLVLLAIILLFAFIHPLGGISDAPIVNNINHMPYLTAF